jgi:hypothetical protein
MMKRIEPRIRTIRGSTDPFRMRDSRQRLGAFVAIAGVVSVVASYPCSAS